jgi:hypothetical protein
MVVERSRNVSGNAASCQWIAQHCVSGSRSQNVSGRIPVASRAVVHAAEGMVLETTERAAIPAHKSVLRPLLPYILL